MHKKDCVDGGLPVWFVVWNEKKNMHVMLDHIKKKGFMDIQESVGSKRKDMEAALFVSLFQVWWSLQK